MGNLKFYLILEKYIEHIDLLHHLVFNMQIMPEVFILGCIYALPAYRNLMRAEAPIHIPIFLINSLVLYLSQK